jgi:predicted dehydrogenase
VHASTIQTILEKTRAYILCEKPLTLDVPQIDMLSKLPGAQTRISGAFVERFHEPFVAMKSWADKQTAPFTMSFSRRTKQPTYAAWFHKPELGGDILLDLGIHDIDLASWFTGTPVISVSDHTYDDDTHESFRLNYQDGSTADFYFGWDLPEDHKVGIENHVSIKSAAGELAYDSTAESLARTSPKKQAVRPRFPEAYYDELKAAISLAGGDTSNDRFPALNDMRAVMEIIQLAKQDRKAQQ